MSRIEEISERYSRHIATPWQRTTAGAQRVIMAVYDKELERTLAARKILFESATTQAGHAWQEIDLREVFPKWMAADEYRDAYFEQPSDLQLKLESEFPHYVADILRAKLTAPEVNDQTVVAVFGVASLFGLARFSEIIRLVERDIRGRLLVFFPGQFEHNNYRLLDARDGWNYLAIPITHFSDDYAP
jgi:hypothetical protein